METKIELVQIPVIKHQLIKVGANVQKRLDDLDIENQIATIDTVKSLKDLRAELNKELAEFESQRKFIKQGILKPYDEFEETYKTEIAIKYNNAISTLKDKIAEVENKIKADKKVKIETYFKELCISEKIDFIDFDRLNLDINLSTTEKAYKEKVNEFITKINDDLALIKTNENEAEILVEYKKTLNASKAITEVNDRKQKEKEEAAKIKQAKIMQRTNHIKKLGLNFLDVTNSYEYPNSDIYITYIDISEMENDKFIEKVAEIEAKIKALKEAEAKNKVEITETPETKKTITTTPAAAIQTPIKEEPKVMAKFQVIGTRQELKSLGEYMKENNLIYKNLF